MKKNLLLLWSFIGSLTFAQQITLDTSLVSEIPNTIDEWWYWSGGFPVNGSQFSPNTEVTVKAIDPNGKPWRNFTGTSDANGNFSIQITSKKNKSIYGDYTIEATDKNGKTATAILTVTKRANDVLNVSIVPNAMTLSDFFSEKFKIKGSGFEPGAEVSVFAFSPNESGTQIEPGPPFSTFEPKYADNDGNFEMDFNIFTVSYPWGDQMPEVEGPWRINLSGYASDTFNGSGNFRILPDNPSTSNYCNIIQTQDENNTIKVTPITYFGIDGVNEHNSGTNSNNYYENFSNISFDLKAGQTYKGTLKGINQSTYAGDTFTLFFDWNQNGILDEENEIVHEAYILGSPTTTTTEQISEFEFTVPENAVNGNTKLRILKLNSVNNYSLYWPSGSCGFYTNDGQVEDYSINITNGITPPSCTLDCPDDITVSTTGTNRTAKVDYDLTFSCEDNTTQICQLEYPSNNFEFGLVASQFTTLANDFVVEEGQTMKLKQVIPNYIKSSYGSTISIYKDNEGKPGELLKKFENVQSTSQTEIGQANDGTVFEVVYDLPETVELASGRYWLALNAQGPLISWESTSNVTTKVSYSTTDEGQTWKELPNSDGVFKLGYECNAQDDLEIVLVDGLDSGADFPIGTTTVTHNLVYKGVILDTCSFDVTVKDVLSTAEVNKSSIKYHPNPVKDVLTISNDEKIEKVTIVDVTGKVVYSKEINTKNTQLNLAHLNSGVYIVKTISNGKENSFKIVKK